MGDLNNDGTPDIVFGNDGTPDKWAPMENTGLVDSSPSGGLKDLEDPSSTTTTDVAIADVDGDGNNDVVIVRKGDVDEIVLNPDPTGTGPGPLTKYVLEPTPGSPPTDSEGVKVVDLNNNPIDNVPEIIIAMANGDNVIYRRDTPGIPGNGLSLPSMTPQDLTHPSGVGGSTSVETVDVDEDGDLDVIFTNDDGTLTTWTNDGNAVLTGGDGSGTRKNTDSSGVMKVADFNGDDIPDVLSGTNIIFQPENTDPDKKGSGTGNFEDVEPNPYTHGGVPTQVVVLDLDREDNMDIVAVVPDQPAVQVLLNRPGSGDFSGDTETVRVPPGELGPFFGIDALQGTLRESHKSGTDTGSDGHNAVSIVLSRPNAISDGQGPGGSPVFVLTPNGGEFKYAISDSEWQHKKTMLRSTGASPGSVNEFEIGLTLDAFDDVNEAVVVDVNNDGIMDIVLGTSAKKKSQLLIGNGDDSFQPPIELAGTDDIHTLSIAVEDVDGDGHKDIVLGNREEENSIIFGRVDPLGGVNSNNEPLSDPSAFSDGAQEKKLTTVGDTIGHPNSARTTSISIVDLDNDPDNGLELIAFGNHYGGVTLVTLENPDPSVRLFDHTRNTNGLKESNVEKVVLEDVNGDGFPDLIVGTSNQGAYILLADARNGIDDKIRLTDFDLSLIHI